MRSKIEIVCPKCEQKTFKDKAEVNRQTKKGNPVFCSKLCASKYLSEKRTVHKKIEKNCLYCDIKFWSSTNKKSNSCCSRICANKYSNTFIDYSTVSSSLKEYYKTHEHFRKGKSCPHLKKRMFIKTDSRNEDGTFKLKCNNCSKIFNHKNKRRKTCSDNCKRVRNSLLCGGETNYRKFKYKDIWLDSSWELQLAQWFDKKNIEWKRSKDIKFQWIDSNGISHMYYPDFFLEKYNIYVDPKNKFLQKKDKEKLDYVRREYRVMLLVGNVNELKSAILSLHQIL